MYRTAYTRTRRTVLSVLASVCLTLPGHALEPIRISTSPDKRPLVTAGERILTLAYQRIGVPLEFVAIPSKRAQVLIEAGQLDGIMVRFADTPGSAAEKVNVPIIYDEAVVFTRDTNFAVDGYASLKPYLVGYVFGITYFEKKLAESRTVTAPNLESLFRMLDAGRTDVAVDVRSSLCVARKLGLGQIHILEPPLSHGAPGYHALNKKHQDIIARLEPVLQRMEKQGELKRIYEEAMQEYMAHCSAP